MKALRPEVGRRGLMDIKATSGSPAYQFLTRTGISARCGEWRDASIWFCGPAGFGQALRQDFAAHGLPRDRFHQELFAMR